MTLKTIKKCRREDVPTGVCVAKHVDLPGQMQKVQPFWF
jgi:hypothetical protein